MCTMTVIPMLDTERSAATDRAQPRQTGVRIAFNRDELRSRPSALPPQVRHFGRRRAILPIDPASGGTWIAASDAGLVLALLNLTEPGPPPRSGARSRGTIIPALLDVDSIDAVIAGAQDMPAHEFAPFRLIVVDGDCIVELSSRSGRVHAAAHYSTSMPCLFTSSGLGDWLVEGPRRELFTELGEQGPFDAQRQDEFHRHQWPGRECLSVCMSRPDACTVSCTVIELDQNMVRLTYEATAEPRTNAMVLRNNSKRGFNPHSLIEALT
jgi:hypothetical protein